MRTPAATKRQRARLLDAREHWGKPAAEGYPTGKGDEPEAVLEEVRSWCGNEDLAAHAWMDKAGYVVAWPMHDSSFGV